MLSNTVASTGAKSERHQASKGAGERSPTSLGELAPPRLTRLLGILTKFSGPLGSQQPGKAGAWVCRSISGRDS